MAWGLASSCLLRCLAASLVPSDFLQRKWNPNLLQNKSCFPPSLPHPVHKGGTVRVTPFPMAISKLCKCRPKRVWGWTGNGCLPRWFPALLQKAHAHQTFLACAGMVCLFSKSGSQGCGLALCWSQIQAPTTFRFMAQGVGLVFF